MHVGDKVLYVPLSGRVVAAEIVAITGTGPNGYKILSLVTETGATATDVPHVVDCRSLSGYWCQRSSEVKTPPPKVRRRVVERTDSAES